VNCAKIGADVMTGPLSAIYGLKHPLTDIGLAQFVADFEKEISNYFIISKRPISIEMGLFIFNVLCSNKWRVGLLDTSPKPMRTCVFFAKTFHDYRYRYH
jgi:hypothetical protein